MILNKKREKVFGSGRAIPLDRNTKVRLVFYVASWSAKHKSDRQHRGPITRAFMEVLKALLWAFHNSRNGQCFPSYERIAEKACCARSTVYDALKILEKAGVLTWQNRITRIRVRAQDLFGRWFTRWRVIRTSNAYVFRDPKPVEGAPVSSKSENQGGTLNQEIQPLSSMPAGPIDPNSPLELALQRLGRRIDEEALGNGSGLVMPAP